MQIEVHVTPPFSYSDARSFEGHVHELALLMRSHNGGVVLVNTLLTFPAVVAAACWGIPSVWAIHESVEPAIFFDHYGDAATRLHPDVREHFEESFRSPCALVFEATGTEALFAELRGSTPGLVVDYGVDVGAIDEIANRSAGRSSGPIRGSGRPTPSSSWWRRSSRGSRTP